MNNTSENVQYPTFSNNLDEADEIYGTNSPNTGMTETEKNGLKLVTVHGNNNQIGVSEPMDTSEEDFELVEIENKDYPYLTGSNACECCKKKWEDEKAKLEMLLQAEKQKVMDMEDTLRMRTEEMEKKNETELMKYNAEKGNWEKQRAELLRSLEEEKEKVITVKICWENEIKEIKQKAEKECERLNSRLVELEERLSEKENDNTTWQNSYKQLEQDKKRELDQLKNEYHIYCKGLIQQHTKENELLLHTVENLKAEKDNLLTRLSSIAADMLTHGNVNVVNLSDADRPTKLQEAYSELYDNGWTDAFEELTEKRVPDNDSSFQKCREITWGRYEKLRYVASSVEILQRNPISVAEKNVATENLDSGDPNVRAAWKDKFERENEKRFQCTIGLGINLEKEIKDIWRKTTVALKELLIEQIYSVIETCQNIPLNGCPITSKYLKSCVNLCWKMGVQEMSMHLDTVAEMDDDCGKKFDTNKFKAYTRSGKNVAFVVWPALFLNEGGPMLAKGIAQGCSSDEKQNTEMHP